MIVFGRAASKRTRSNAASRGASRCSMTSTTVAASYPARRLSRYISEPCINFSRSFCLVGIRSSRRRWIAISRLRYETSIPTISVNDFSSNRARRSFPSPQPRSMTRFASTDRSTSTTAPIRCCHSRSGSAIFVASAAADIVLRSLPCWGAMPANLPPCAGASQPRRSQSSSASPRRAPGSVHKDDSTCPASGTFPPRSLSSTVPHPTLEISRQADGARRARDTGVRMWGVAFFCASCLNVYNTLRVEEVSPMSETLPGLEAQRSKVLRQITELGDLRPGSITGTIRRCGKPTCHCARASDPGHGPNLRLTFKTEGKNVTEALPTPSAVHKAEREIEEFRKFQKLSHSFVQLSEKICRLRPGEEDSAQPLTPQEKKRRMRSIGK